MRVQDALHCFLNVDDGGRDGLRQEDGNDAAAVLAEYDPPVVFGLHLDLCELLVGDEVVVGLADESQIGFCL